MHLGLLLALAFSPSVHSQDRNATAGNTHCYTCVWDNMPEISKAIMKKSLNLPEYAKSRACADHIPSNPEMIQKMGIKVESCNSPCVKVVSSSKYMKLVVRGCMERIFTAGMADPRSHSPTDASTSAICDHQRHESDDGSETVTDTCLCFRDYCNGATKVSGHSSRLTVFLSAAITYLIISKIMSY